MYSPDQQLKWILAGSQSSGSTFQIIVCLMAFCFFYTYQYNSDAHRLAHRAVMLGFDKSWNNDLSVGLYAFLNDF